MRWIVKMEKMLDRDKFIDRKLDSLLRSSFRSSFRLRDKDREYIDRKGLEVIRDHAYDFIRKRLAPLKIDNDGKQTPMRGHPIFIAQHATGCCCRGCLYKWHKIEMNRELSDEEIDYIVEIVMKWIKINYK